jgi:hypothetical protein
LQPTGTEPLSGTFPTGAPPVHAYASFVKILRPFEQVFGLLALRVIGPVFVLPWAQSGLQSLSWPVPLPVAAF